LNACVENLDFNQIEYSATPVYHSPLVFFDLNQNNFIDPTTNTEIATVIDVTDFTYLETSVFRDNLERVELAIEVNNQFDRDFMFTMEFLDENNNLVYSIGNFTATANQLTVPTINPIVIANNQNFLQTRKIRITIDMGSSTTPLSPNVIQNISFKSSGTYYVRT
jgi:hypothetical protein